ncbi:MAG: S-layer homology domain-containing protein [Capsulimonadaceae bacterium]
MNKKAITLIAGAGLLALGMPSMVHAQAPAAASGPFADVPADHWAYNSVDTLQKAGIVIGYPDGTFGGKRAMTRYEFAVAIARVLPLISQMGANYATKDDLAAFRADQEQKLQANSDAIDALRKLVDEFTPELQKLGQDVAGVKDRLDALEARVAAVEQEQRRVKIVGALNVIAESENMVQGSPAASDFVYDQNGTKFGGAGSTVNKHLLADGNVDEDFFLGIKGRVSDTASANVALDFGNYLSQLGNTAAPGYMAGTDLGVPSSSQYATLWQADLSTPVNLGPLGNAHLMAGRFANQWTRYTFSEVNSDVYVNLYQTNSGNIPVDGAKVAFDLGPADVNVWAGQMSKIPFAQPYAGAALPSKTAAGQAGVLNLPGGLLGAPTAAAPIVQGDGIRATFGSAESTQLGLSVEQFGLGSVQTPNPPPSDTSTSAPPVDPTTGTSYGVLSVYGADLTGDLPLLGSSGLKIDANWTASGESTNSSGFNNVANGWKYQSTDDQLGYSSGSLSLKGGYQYVGPYFSAPGDWGRAGSWINPTNIEGGVVSAKYEFSPKFSINGDYNGYKAAYSDTFNPLTGSDTLTRWQVGGALGLTDTYTLDAGYEEDLYDLKSSSSLYGATPATAMYGGPTSTGATPTQSFWTVALDHSFTQNASFKLLYQIVQYKDKSTGFLNPAAPADTTADVAVGQFQLKF